MKARSPTLTFSAITPLSSHLTTMAQSQAAIVVSTLPIIEPHPPFLAYTYCTSFGMRSRCTQKVHTYAPIDNYSMFFFQTFSPLPSKTLLIYHLRKRYPVAHEI